MLGRYLLKFLLLPPSLNIALLLLGFALLWRKKRTGLAVMFFSILLLTVFSLPCFSSFLQRSLEYWPPLGGSGVKKTGADAIIVLAAGKYHGAPEFGRGVANEATLERLQYAAHLKRLTGLPILVTGGSVFEDDGESLAEVMAYSLENQFGVEVNWQENKSRTTWENAFYSKAICEKEGINRILLITHALHMPRSFLAFKKVGFEVIPAPTHYNDARFKESNLLSFMPSAIALNNTSQALYEILGYLWYSFRY